MKRLLVCVLAYAVCLLGGESYSFYFLSDPHFGESGSYAKRPDDPTKYVTKKNVFRSDKARAVYQALFEHAAAGFDDKTRFVIEGGDFVEGTFIDGATHREQLKKHWDWMCGILSRPVYPVMGNHDAVGDGGKEAFQAVLGAEIERLTGQAVVGCKAQYRFRQGDDLFIVLDYYSSARDWQSFVSESVSSFVGKPRHIFIVSHGNVVQMSSSLDALGFLDAVKGYHPIVLCGHTHETLLLDYEDAGGRVTQFSLGTMLQPEAEACAYGHVHEDKGVYFRWLEGYYVRRKKDFQPIKERVLPNIRRVWQASGQGMARVDVSDSGIELSLQGADVSRMPLKIRLR